MYILRIVNKIYQHFRYIKTYFTACYWRLLKPGLGNSSEKSYSTHSTWILCTHLLGFPFLGLITKHSETKSEWEYFDQGNLKGESVVAAILQSCMEVRYCTSGFFHSQACQIISLNVALSVWSQITHAYRLSCSEIRGNDHVSRSRWMIAPNPKVQ